MIIHSEITKKPTFMPVGEALGSESESSGTEGVQEGINDPDEDESLQFSLSYDSDEEEEDVDMYRSTRRVSHAEFWRQRLDRSDIRDSYKEICSCKTNCMLNFTIEEVYKLRSSHTDLSAGRL